MNEFIIFIILSIVQGITEWFPISSSAHLILIAKLFNYAPSFDFIVAVHLGTLMAVFVYLGRDIVDIIKDLARFKFKTEKGKLGIAIIIATIPAAIIGLTIHNLIENIRDNILLMAIGLGITSLSLFISSITPKKETKTINYKKAALIGLSQVLSLFRGISRSGSTISTALILGIDMKNAVKFSYLISIPIIIGANIIEIGNQKLSPILFLPTLISFIVGIASIHVSFKYILTNRKNLKWFAIYTMLLALVIIIGILF